MIDKGPKTSVLFVETGSGYGGSSKYLFELLKRLDRTRFAPFVMYAEDAPNINQIKSLGIVTYKLALNIHPVEIPVLNYLHLMLLLIIAVLPNAFRVRSVIKRNQIDIVYLNNEIFSHFSVILAAVMEGKKIICHNHGLRRLTALEKVFVRFIDYFVCVSKATQNAIKNDIGNKPVQTVYNGLDIEDYCTDTIVVDEEIRALRKTSAIIGIAGRIVPWKGHRIFVDAANIVLRQMKKSVVFFVVGDDLSPQKAYLDELKGYVSHLGIEKKVIFTGWQKDVNSFLDGFDIVIHPSVEPEPFGLAIIEAMALGRPVIASRIGAIPEIIGDQVNGLLFKTGDSVNLAEKIILLLGDEKMRNILGSQARQTVIQRFDIKRNVKEIEKIIEDVSGGVSHAE